MDLYLGWLVRPKVGQIVVVLLANARELGPGEVQTVYRVKTSGRTVFEDAPEEGEAWSTPAMQDAPLRPPEDVLRVQIGLTVTNVSAIDGPYPEAMNHFLG